MQYEHPPQTINFNETSPILESAILGPEISSLPPEAAVMFEAENNALFDQFLTTLEQDVDELRQAEGGDPVVIEKIASSYRDFRFQFEEEIESVDPDAYKKFCKAIEAGDISEASDIVNKFFDNKKRVDESEFDENEKP